MISRRDRWVGLASLVAGIAVGILVHWFAGLFIVYWVIWAVLVERTVGLRTFAFFDTRDSPPRDTPSLRWAAWILAALILSGVVVYVGIRTPEPLAVAGLLLVINTVYTPWALRSVGRRLQEARGAP